MAAEVQSRCVLEGHVLCILHTTHTLPASIHSLKKQVLLTDMQCKALLTFESKIVVKTQNKPKEVKLDHSSLSSTPTAKKQLFH